ncbi:MAG: Glu-tRNA(Gln) amidotransferase subunit GatE [Archaeoglobaceae archaeon]|nr:Glu-tRNA(Gln) amidotransferase subunit GatE [Archaeoglobaceae archaeon]MDW8118046.1 Glu-tRNA(Gln) amidotransferase subunit GatE [Archaeoglobaceae archaeon]
MSEEKWHGLKVGIEIHQQLDTKEKLFCKCPTESSEESKLEIKRYLRLKKSEMGEEDRAAREEVERRKKFLYKFYDSTCLVEADEEPPTEMNREALKIAIQVAKMLKMTILDEIHVMRKIVIDGSNTTGFQRTALVAVDGEIEVKGEKIGIGTLCLEEEACRKIEEGEGFTVYSLDRLGIPLIEIGTKADIRSPEIAKETAKKLGMILRSTGKVKRGIGTIRQDVNISIKDGARVEIKGVQELDLIDKVVEYEVLRQLTLLKIKDELQKRSAQVIEKIFDVTDLFKNTKSKILKGKDVKAILLKNFAGVVGREIQPGRRLGSEFADIARAFGLGGIFHTDELPAYGITAEEVNELRKKLGASERDAIVFGAGDPERVERALRRIVERAKYCFLGVPEETRKANEDATTSYLRPLPGSARMYPETDVPPVFSHGDLDVEIPELIEERAKRYEKFLSPDLAFEIADSKFFKLFEEFIDSLPATIVARVLHVIPTELRRENCNVDLLKEKHFKMVLEMVRDGEIAKEGAENALKFLIERPSASKDEVKRVIGSKSDIDSFIQKLVDEKKELIAEKGENAFKPLMGIVMGEFRGKVDGKVIAEKLREAIVKKIKELEPQNS